MAQEKISNIIPKFRKTIWMYSLDFLCYLKLDEKKWAERYFEWLIKSGKAAMKIGKEKLTFKHQD